MRHSPRLILRGLIILACVLHMNIAFAKDVIRIGWVHAMGNAPVLIAERNGYFQQQGIEVELKTFDSGPLARRALEAGDLDIVYIGLPPIYKAYAEGLDIRIIAKVNYGQAALLVNKQSPIKTVKDLKGHKIAGIRRGSGMDVLLCGFVLQEKAGLDHNEDVDVIRMPAKMMNGALDNKVVEAIFTWEPYVTLSLIHDDARILLDMNETFEQYPWYVIVATNSFIKNHPEDAKAVLRAHVQAVNFLNMDNNNGNAIIAKEFRIAEISMARQGDTRYSPVEIVAMAKSRTGWQYRFSRSDFKFMQQLVVYSHDLGFIPRKININKLIDTRFINSVTVN